MFFTLFLQQKKTPDRVDDSKAIKIRIVETKPKNDPAPPKVAVSKPVAPNAMRPTKPDLKNADPATTDEEKNTRATSSSSTYKDFFPGPTWPAGSVVGNSNRAATQVSSETKKITGHLEGQLDIPLIFRENTAISKAVAKFRKDQDGRWSFEYIDGEAVLRAVVYQAFRNRKNMEKIEALADELKTNELIFILEQQTKPALNGMKQFADQMSYSGNRIIYTRMIFTGDDGSQGIPLPDEEAKRAKRRDKAALLRLMDSPAYHSPIRNRKID